MKILYVSLLLSGVLSVQAHPGRTDAEGCHAGKLPRHCHDNQAGRDAPAKKTKRSSTRKTASEDEYNRRFCAAVGGVIETRHTYMYEGGSSYVKVDCETDTTVYEEGLDKRSSLDSLQQALFFSVLTGKQPAVVIYDTDGREGRFEYRIRTACQEAGVHVQVAVFLGVQPVLRMTLSACDYTVTFSPDFWRFILLTSIFIRLDHVQAPVLR